jgi:hypothetical protein
VYQCRKRGGVAEDENEMTHLRSASSLSFIERKRTLLGLRCRTICTPQKGPARDKLEELTDLELDFATTVVGRENDEHVDVRPILSDRWTRGLSLVAENNP